MAHFAELHQLLALQFQQSHAHMGHFSVLKAVLLFLENLVVAQLAQLAEVVRELQVHFVLHKGLHFLNVFQRFLCQLSMPLVVDFERGLRLPDVEPFVDRVEFVLALPQVALQFVHLVFKSVLQALKLAAEHQQVCCHRYLKPANFRSVFFIGEERGLRLSEMLLQAFDVGLEPL